MGLRIGSRKGAADFPLIVLVTILTIFGVVMVFSASYYNSISHEGSPYSYLIRQGTFALIGFVLMAVCSRIDYHLFKRSSVLILVVSMVLLALLFTPFGVNINGATRWLNFGIGLTIMPGEIAKFAVLIFLSAYFSAQQKNVRTLGGLLLPILIVGLICLAIARQPNLSTAITVALLAVAIAFLAGLQWRYLVLAIIAGGAGIVYLAIFGDGYQQQRILSFLDPFADAQGDGYQVVQSLLALGTGGVKGVGIGRSVQKTLYLPEPQNDFILSIIGEELGFIGILVLLIVFMLLIWRCLTISARADDRFGMLVAGGTGLLVGIQVALNVAVATSSMPPTGIAMPFISYGGNALWIFMGAMGIVLNISRKREPQEPEESRLG